MHITDIYYYPSQKNQTQRQYLQATLIQSILNTPMVGIPRSF